MKSSECKGYYGAVWLVTQKDLSKFGYAKVGAMPKQEEIVSVLFMAKPQFGYAKI